jgi:hypothetical protein
MPFWREEKDRQRHFYKKEEQKKKVFPRSGTYLHDANTTQKRADSYDYPASCTKRQKKTERRSYYGIQSQFCFMSLEVSGCYLGFYDSKSVGVVRV